MRRLRAAIDGRAARRAWGAVFVLLLAFTLAMALAPEPRGPTLGQDKANHVTAFAVLAFSSWFAIAGLRLRAAWIAVGLLAVGAGIELAQSRIPGRSAELSDLIADALGIAIGMALGHALARAAGQRAAGDDGPLPASASARRHRTVKARSTHRRRAGGSGQSR